MLTCFILITIYYIVVYTIIQYNILYYITNWDFSRYLHIIALLLV